MLFLKIASFYHIYVQNEFRKVPSFCRCLIYLVLLSRSSSLSDLANRSKKPFLWLFSRPDFVKTALVVIVIVSKKSSRRLKSVPSVSSNDKISNENKPESKRALKRFMRRVPKGKRASLVSTVSSCGKVLDGNKSLKPRRVKRVTKKFVTRVKRVLNDLDLSSNRGVGRVTKRDFTKRDFTKRGFMKTSTLCIKDCLTCIQDIPRFENCLTTHPRFLTLMRSGDVELNPGPLSGFSESAETEGDCREQHDHRGNSRKGNGNSKCDLLVMSFNVRGLGDSKKLRHLVNNCYKLSRDAVDSIFMLQESHASHLKLLKFLWRGDFCETPGTGASKGCLTLLSPMLKALKTIEFDQRAHIVVVGKSDINRAELILVNVYGPNQNNQGKLEFFINIVETLSELKLEYDCERVIFAGDFNVVFNKREVKNRAYPAVEQKLARNLKGIFSAAELSDGWNEDSIETKFTWQASRNNQQYFSTLDRVLFGKSKLNLLSKTVDWSLSVSDHAAVLAKFNYPIASKRSHILRLDGSLLKDQDAVDIMNREFHELFDQKSEDWNPHQTLEFIKLCIRTAVMASIGQSRRKYKAEEERVNDNINNLVEKLAHLPADHLERPVVEALLIDQRSVKRDLINKIGTKLQQRCSRRWYNEGELSNKYFFNLLNRKVSDEITSLEVNGCITSQPEEIKDGFVNFYKNLYEITGCENELTTDESFFSELSRVDASNADNVVKRITLEELTTVLNSCNDSAPGPDGIPYSILKHFWQDFGPVLIKAWEFSLEIKQLPPSHKQSYLRLIPKARKDLRKIGNWRPITLSNTDHKLITKLLSIRLTRAVETCIGNEQTAYIPGRLINDNIRAMLSTIDISNLESEIDGLIISLDAKKAFDSVSHRYIEQTLKAFGLNSFVPIFRLLYKELRSDVIINGEVRCGYKIMRGVKQGDALSCILFIMCIEPLIRNIKRNNQIIPIASETLNSDLPKVYSFADDVTVLTVNNENCVQQIFKEYQCLTEISGLTLNAEKTELLRINKRDRDVTEFRVEYCGSTFRLESQESIKINGILMLQDPNARMRENGLKINAAMERHLATWSTRSLSLMGKILVAKTFAISQIIFFMQSSRLTETYLKMFETSIFKFLWNKNMSAAKAPDRIKREIMTTPVKYGGFGMLDIKELDRGIKLKSYGRLLTSSHPFITLLKSKSNLTNFFDVSAPKIESVLTEALKFLKEDRLKILEWDIGLQQSNLDLIAAVRNIAIKDVLTPAGRQSVAFLLLRANSQLGINIRVKDLTPNDLNHLTMHIKNRSIFRLLQASSTLNVPEVVERQPSLYPTKTGHLGDLRKLSIKEIREARMIETEKIICMYKIGLALTPGEVLSWTSKIRKLTSVRHRSILLRIAHGEVYSNSRLFRFGLITSPGCENCDCDLETIAHKIVECQAAKESWKELNLAKVKLGLQTGQISLEGIMGTGIANKDKLSLVLNAELLQVIISQGGKRFDPKTLVNRVLRTIAINEPLTHEVREKLASCVNS